MYNVHMFRFFPTFITLGKSFRPENVLKELFATSSAALKKASNLFVCHINTYENSETKRSQNGLKTIYLFVKRVL
jgi:hypothetical protein